MNYRTQFNASELRDKLTSDLPGPVSGKGLLVFSGALPDTVFSTSLLEDWIDAGGFLYWTGDTIGRYMSTPDDMIEVDRGSDLVGTDSFEDDVRAAYDTDYRRQFAYESQLLHYVPDLDSVRSSGRQALGAGFTDDEGHCTVSYIQKGSGQVCVTGGDYNMIQIRDMAIACGLTYASVITESSHEEFRDSASGPYGITTVGNISLFVSIGGYFCAKAQRFDF